MRKFASRVQPKSTGVRQKPVWVLWTARGVLFFSAAVISTVILFFDLEPVMGKHGFTIGEPAPRTYFSPINLSFENEAKTEASRQRLVSTVPPVYVFQREPEKLSAANLEQFLKALQAVQTAPLAENKPEFPFEISEVSIKAFLSEPNLDEVRKTLLSILNQIFPAGILDTNEKKELAGTGQDKIHTLKKDLKEEKQRLIDNVPSRAEVLEKIPGMIPDAIAKKKILRNALVEAASALVQVNLLYDETETQLRRAAVAASAPPVEETVKRDELVIQRGMLVTPEAKVVIDQIQKKSTEREILQKLSSSALLVMMTYLFLFMYLYIFEKKMVRSAHMSFLVVTVFLVTLVFCKVIRVWPGSSLYFMPAALAPLLLVLLVSPRLGAAATLAMTALAAPLADFAPDMILSVFFTGMAGTFAALKVRKRVEFLRVGGSVGLAQALVIFSYHLYQDHAPMEALQVCALGFVNGFLITMPCLFLLIALFEALFNLATDITLLELSDLNHPLLKRMIIEAPGTYHHSLVVSRLAEGACESIKANALLARVGCYFHDIGKIAKSEFFTENQSSKHVSKHEKLTPTMSSLVIINHVKEGIELGKKYKLKDSVLKFIPEHQGTGVVYFFYRRALDQAAPGEVVNPDDFRYPGPRPQSKETAVALLSDSVEAASRSLKEPTGESIRNLVRKIINDKFIDGQLDECDLTLRDLFKIQESFVHNLMAIFHTRVPYPEKTENADKPDLFKSGQFQKFR